MDVLGNGRANECVTLVLTCIAKMAAITVLAPDAPVFHKHIVFSFVNFNHRNNHKTMRDKYFILSKHTSVMKHVSMTPRPMICWVFCYFTLTPCYNNLFGLHCNLEIVFHKQWLLVLSCDMMQQIMQFDVFSLLMCSTKSNFFHNIYYVTYIYVYCEILELLQIKKNQNLCWHICNLRYS